jgi:hypothetical protein
MARPSLPQAGCGRWDVWMGISRTVCNVILWNTRDYCVQSNCVRTPVKAEGVVVRGQHDMGQEHGSREDKDFVRETRIKVMDARDAAETRRLTSLHNFGQHFLICFGLAMTSSHTLLPAPQQIATTLARTPRGSISILFCWHVTGFPQHTVWKSGRRQMFDTVSP